MDFYKKKNMCSFQTLFQDNNTGYAVRCKECEKIQLGFGNLMLTLNEREFDSFHNRISEMLSQQPADCQQTVRCIVIPTPCEGINLLLSLRELKMLDQMLEEADTELKSSCLIDLFNQEM